MHLQRASRITHKIIHNLNLKSFTIIHKKPSQKVLLQAAVSRRPHVDFCIFRLRLRDGRICLQISNKLLLIMCTVLITKRKKKTSSLQTFKST